MNAYPRGYVEQIVPLFCFNANIMNKVRRMFTLAVLSRYALADIHGYNTYTVQLYNWGIGRGTVGRPQDTIDNMIYLIISHSCLH